LIRVSVIAVGGFALSRGLTLEGLMVSYFLRNSMMYDTLMQMGRWFGYRGQSLRSGPARPADVVAQAARFRTEGHPDVVSRGAQKNFAHFALNIGREWTKNPDEFNEAFFRESIAKAIIFRATEKLVTEQSWYQGGYRANIVAYTATPFANIFIDPDSSDEMLGEDLLPPRGTSGAASRSCSRPSRQSTSALPTPMGSPLGAPPPSAPRGRETQAKTCSLYCSSWLLLTDRSLRESRGGSVRWLLAEAAAIESQSAFEAAARQREFAASMSHGTVTAIRSIGTSSVVKMLIRADAIDQDNPGSYSVEDLIFDLKNPSDNADSHKRELVDTLRRMETAENIAASLAALVEILAEGGAIREKFQSGRETSLRGLIDTAWSQAAYLSKASLKRESGAADESSYDWTLPSDYISDRFLVGVMTELFQNSAAHGVTKDNESGAVEVAVFGKEDSVTVQIQNRYETGPSESRNISGFLSRAKLLMAEIDGIDLAFDSNEENSVFTVSLSLAAIQITKNGPSGYPATEFFVSHPNRV
jgi:hypothetical protein